MANTINFKSLGLTAKNSMKVKEYAKNQLNTFIMEKVKEYYGEENVSEVFKDGNNMKGYALSVGMGTVEDEGFDIEVCVNIELTAKAITECTRKTSTGYSTTEIYDRQTEAEIYKQETERKAEEKANKKKVSDMKKAKDQEKRNRMKELAEAKKKVQEKLDEKTKQDLEKAKEKENESTIKKYYGEEIKRYKGKKTKEVK